MRKIAMMPARRGLTGRLLAGVIGLALAGTFLTACGGGDTDKAASGGSSSGDNSSYVLNVGGTATGSDALIWSWIQSHGLLDKYGLKVKRYQTADFSALYSDFAAGRYDVCLGTISGFAPLAAKGLPIRMLDSYSTDNSFIVAKRQLKIPDDLKGMRISAPTSSGTYRVFQALLKEAYGFDLAKEAKVLPASNGAAAILQVGSGAADAAFVFEPDASTALLKYKNLGLQTTFSTNAAFKAKYNGEPMITSTFAYNYDAKIPDEVLKKFNDLITEAVNEIMADPQAADQLSQQLAKTYPGAYASSLTSGRQSLKVETIGGETETAAKDQIAMLVKSGILEKDVPDTFYGPSPLS